MKSSPSVLLASGSASGTLAAVRALGKNGIDASILSSEPLSAAAWSRWASRSYSAPPETDTDRFLTRLISIGAKHAGQILLPTSDETTWLYTANADVLAKHFNLYQPAFSTVQKILDKGLLAAAATEAGLPVVPSWYPSSTNDLNALAPTLPYPILIKPRTHVHRLRNDKGVVVQSADELSDQYEQFIDREQTQISMNGGFPILQQFIDVGGRGVLSVTGFIDRAGKYFVTRHATKIFQRSQPVGVGVCFESSSTDAALSEAVRRLCNSLGYFGIFEVEFLWFKGSWAAIDFNPRLYNQVAMDIRRGMPLPLLACLDAADERAALHRAIIKAQEDETQDNIVFCDRFTLSATLCALALTSRISRRDYAYWRSWTRQNAQNMVDAAKDSGDWMPGLIHAASEVGLGLKAFPRFLRATPRRHSKERNFGSALP